MIERHDGSLRIEGAVIGAGQGVFDLILDGGRIAAIAPSGVAARTLCLPPLADLHLHACRAFLGAGPPVAGLGEAVKQVQARLADYGPADYARHAARLYGRARGHGTTRMRTHADVDARVGLDAVLGSLQAREAVDAAVEVVAFVTARGDPAGAEEQAMLRDAVAQGATMIGAALDFVVDAGRAIDALLDLAGELDVGVDVHLDEHLDPGRSHSRRFAEAVSARALPDVTISHACAVGALEAPERSRAIDAFLAAGVTVIALPATNLFLQDRAGGAAARRGITCVAELLAAGVPLRFASDNVRDPFYPLGDGDLLDVAAMAMTGVPLADEAALVAGICDGRATLSAGDPADLVLVPAASFAEALATRPAGRTVLRGGRPLPSAPAQETCHAC
ncbi:hypothetical protein [Sphingomonas sp.]|uniref:hypothetical protein n=1 Tax=Sphingomonas sp. TaxID=28214 RepID=UPI001B2E7AB0|nr:hypothetical protein [Sphingomonas sp.]MBO9711660.1 hypothetical protein [Sphingomonas sp.]